MSEKKIDNANTDPGTPSAFKVDASKAAKATIEGIDYKMETPEADADNASPSVFTQGGKKRIANQGESKG